MLAVGLFPGRSVWEKRLVGARFHEKWPPISDEEFLRRCHVGVNRDIALRTRRVIAEQLGIPKAQIYPEQHFVHDLMAD